VAVEFHISVSVPLPGLDTTTSHVNTRLVNPNIKTNCPSINKQWLIVDS